jgi:hypothetical protein
MWSIDLDRNDLALNLGMRWQCFDRVAVSCEDGQALPGIAAEPERVRRICRARNLLNDCDIRLQAIEKWCLGFEGTPTAVPGRYPHALP